VVQQGSSHRDGVQVASGNDLQHSAPTMTGPTLPLPVQSGRLTLRWYRDEDMEGLFALQSDSGQLAYVPFDVRTREEVAEHLAWRLSNRTLSEPDDRLGVAVIRTDDGAYLGDLVIFFQSAENQGGEIGYMLLAGHQGKGYATEAVTGLLDLAFGSLGLRRIVAHIDARNSSSAAVAERVGMRLEAQHVEDEHFKGEWTDSLIYAMLRSEWEKRRSAYPVGKG